MNAPEVRETRALIFADLETLGLDPDRHPACEVAWHNVSTGEHGWFLPEVTPRDLQLADPESLRINGFAARLAGQPHDDGTEAVRLHRQLRGNTLVAATPGFDSRRLGALFARADRDCKFESGELGPPGPSRPLRLREPWHHRMVDVSTASAAVLGLPWTELPSLTRCCELLGVTNHAPHTARGDVGAAVRCLEALDVLRLGRCGQEPPLTYGGLDLRPCVLPIGHPGWHRAEDGCEWGERASGGAA